MGRLCFVCAFYLRSASHLSALFFLFECCYFLILESGCGFGIWLCFWGSRTLEKEEEKGRGERGNGIGGTMDGLIGIVTCCDPRLNIEDSFGIGGGMSCEFPPFPFLPTLLELVEERRKMRW
jgi:hypothetical protein